MSPDPQFRPAEFAIARLSLLGSSTAIPEIPRTLDDLAGLREFLTTVAADPAISEAITVSSESLAIVLDRLVAGEPVRPKRLRRAALSAARYLSRMSSRATPFGLMAGVTSARFDNDVKVRIGTAHRKQVRPDTAWLTSLVRNWEIDPAVLGQLRVVSSDGYVVRGDRLVLPHLPESDRDRGPDQSEHTVRYTSAVRMALGFARTPCRFEELVEHLAAEFPAVAGQVVRAMLTELVRQGFLVTSLRPPATSPDPLRHILDALSGVPGHTGRDALSEIAETLAEYADAPVGAGRSLWDSATRRMRRLQGGERLLQVDVGMEADIVLPSDVAEELAQAVAAAWQAAPAGAAPMDPLAPYRAEFIETYGMSTLVPVKELLDPQRGLGAPAGYLRPPGHRSPSPAAPADTPRGRLLLALAQRATARGEAEIVLDEDVLTHLRRPGAEDEPGSEVEVCASLLANSEEDLRSGDYRLVIAPINYSRSGAMFGRHLSLVPNLAAQVTGWAADALDAVPAQLISSVVGDRLGNVTRVPRLTEQTIEAGVFADRSDQRVHGLDELAISADRNRFLVVSLRTGEELVPLPFNALSAVTGLPNAARLLAEIGEQYTPPWQLWNWGPAEQLPYLPRVRYGRTVLAAARWSFDPALAESGTSETGWLAAFERWRTEWTVPDRGYLRRSDHRVGVDLTSPLQLRLLREELRRNPGTVLQEEPLAGDYHYGWNGGHATEIVVPLRPRQKRYRPRQRPSTARPAAAHRLHQPGGSWLSLKVYAAEPVHDELLVRHLPALLEHATDVVDRWFFLRYRDDRPHLRIRFHCEPGGIRASLTGAVHDWAADLAAAGLIRETVVDTYRPEIARYGGIDAIDAAEQAFCADSASVLDQLTMGHDGATGLPAALLGAANCVDLARHLCGGEWRDWLVETFRRENQREAFQRHRDEAVRLLDPDGGWPGLSDLDGGPGLVATWSRRASRLALYGELVRDLVARGRLESASTAFSGVLHMHHNRLVGIAPVAEQCSYAIARGVAHVSLEWERHLSHVS